MLLGHGQHGQRHTRRRGPDGDVRLVVHIGRRQQALAQVGLALVVPLDHDDFLAMDGHGAACGVLQPHHQPGLGLLAVGLQRPGFAIDVGDANFPGLAEGRCGKGAGQCGQRNQGTSLHGVVS